MVNTTIEYGRLVYSPDTKAMVIKNRHNMNGAVFTGEITFLPMGTVVMVGKMEDRVYLKPKNFKPDAYFEKYSKIKVGFLSYRWEPVDPYVVVSEHSMTRVIKNVESVTFIGHEINKSVANRIATVMKGVN